MKAKFIYATLLAVMFLSSNVYSQRGLEIKLGPEAGINIANFSGTPDPNTNTRTGLIFGANLELGFSKNFSVQPGLRFIMKGASSSSAAGTVTDKLNYLEIPVLLKVNFPLTEVLPYLIAGPVLGINMSASEDQTPTGGTTTTVDVSNSISGTDFNLLVGGGVGFRLTKRIDLFAQFAYAFGLSNILKNNTTSTLKNNGIQLTAGAMFDL
jgi:opacity protein-like surface antigen